MQAPKDWKKVDTEAFWNYFNRVEGDMIGKYAKRAVRESKDLLEYKFNIYQDSVMETCKKYGINYGWEERN